MKSLNRQKLSLSIYSLPAGAFRYLIVLVLLAGTSFVSAQTVSLEKFGQNRVQYKDFIFSYYVSDNFITHFYQGGQDVAKFVIKTAEDNADEISKMLDVRYKQKIDIIVYNNINELNQTNIGIYEPNQNPGGTINIPEGKIFVYFNGDHRNLEMQVKEGIARIYMNKMVRGSGFAEMVQNAVLLNLPDWYREGLIKYIGEGWTSEMEDKLRDGILTGRYKQLNKLPPAEAVFVGQSIWHYIEEAHGKTALNNIIYLTRVNRSVDNGFLFVLGTNLSQTLEEWYLNYYNRFSEESKISSQPAESSIVKFKTKKEFDYYQPRLSADGKHVAFASNDMGRYKVHLVNIEDGSKKVILRGGFRTNTQFTDQSIPLLAWDPSGKKLAIITDKRSQISITYYDVETGKKEKNPIRKFQKVVSFNYVDSKQLVMSAMQNGQSDIYLYNIASTTTRKLTDDYYDDLQPAYINADSVRGIMFVSNREDDTLRPQRYESQVMNHQYDLFFYDLDANQNVLYRITNTPLADETYPQGFSDNEFSFLSDANGVRNRFTGHFDRVFDHNQKTYRFAIKESGDEDSVQVYANVPLDSAIDRSSVDLVDSSFEKVYKTGGISKTYTNYTYSIREQSVVPSKGMALDMFKVDNKIQFKKYNIESTASNGKAPIMEFMNQLQKKEQSPAGEEPKKEEKQVKVTVQRFDSLWANKGNKPNDFQSDFDYGIKLFDWDSASLNRPIIGTGGYMFRFSKVRPYFVRLMVDKVIAQVDNNPIVTRYQPFDPSNPQYNTNLFSFMIKVGVTDLLEDHKIYGGFRLPFAGLNGNSEYFITYENLKKRLDKKFTFYRSATAGTAATQLPFSNRTLPDGVTANYSKKTAYLETQLNYPLDVLNRLGFTFGFRNDKIVYKAMDTLTLNLPTLSDNWLSARAEYVFDNCIEVLTNIRYGTRFKVFAEVQKEFPTTNKSISDRLDIPVPKFNNVVLGIIGFDLRHYLKVYKQIIWANRLSAGASFGTAKMIYYLGGYDNWIAAPSFQKFDYSTPIDYNNHYAFQTLATPLRGFKQNARNGDKYILFNSEFRVPIFSAFINSPIKSEFIRNMELIGFFDAGSAWQGWSPFNNSTLFTQELPNSSQDPSVIVKLQRYKTPVIMGFGPGIRTSFLGYFIRFDTAWGYDTGEITKKPIYYFSLGLDF